MTRRLALMDGLIVSEALVRLLPKCGHSAER